MSRSFLLTANAVFFFFFFQPVLNFLLAIFFVIFHSFCKIRNFFLKLICMNVNCFSSVEAVEKSWTWSSSHISWNFFLIYFKIFQDELVYQRRIVFKTMLIVGAGKLGFLAIQESTEVVIISTMNSYQLCRVWWHWLRWCVERVWRKYRHNS